MAGIKPPFGRERAPFGRLAGGSPLDLLRLSAGAHDKRPTPARFRSPSTYIDRTMRHSPDAM